MSRARYSRRRMGRIKLDVNLNLFNDKLRRKVFLPHPSSPAKRGYSKNPLSITFSSISLQISE